MIFKPSTLQALAIVATSSMSTKFYCSAEESLGKHLREKGLRDDAAAAKAELAELLMAQGALRNEGHHWIKQEGTEPYDQEDNDAEVGILSSPLLEQQDQESMGLFDHNITDFVPVRGLGLGNFWNPPTNRALPHVT